MCAAHTSTGPRLEGDGNTEKGWHGGTVGGVFFYHRSVVNAVGDMVWSVSLLGTTSMRRCDNLEGEKKMERASAPGALGGSFRLPAVDWG